MAYYRTPVQNMQKTEGHLWVFFAVVKEGNVIDHLYIRDHTKIWWRIEYEMPIVTARTGSPLAKYPDGILAITGPVRSFPTVLVPAEGKPALAEAMAACRAIAEEASDVRV